MAEKLTDRQWEVLECIREAIRETGMSPTRAELADMMGFQSKNAASDHLKALERKGYIQLHPDRSRGIQLLEDPIEIANDVLFDEIPVVGSVAAGVPIEAIENIEYSIPVPEGMFRRKPTYLLRVRGDSMKDAGILDGDLIAVRKTRVADAGEIVVARIDDEVTVKELALDRRSRNKITLLPHNDDFEPIVVSADEVSIEGVFVGLIRDV